MNFSKSRNFERKIGKLPGKVKKALALRLRIFALDPFNPILRNHPLRGSMRNYRSINITGDWRLVYENADGDTVRLIDIDTHSNLYG